MWARLLTPNPPPRWRVGDPATTGGVAAQSEVETSSSVLCSRLGARRAALSPRCSAPGGRAPLHTQKAAPRRLVPPWDPALRHGSMVRNPIKHRPEGVGVGGRARWRAGGGAVAGERGAGRRNTEGQRMCLARAPAHAPLFPFPRTSTMKHRGAGGVREACARVGSRARVCAGGARRERKCGQLPAEERAAPLARLSPAARPSSPPHSLALSERARPLLSLARETDARSPPHHTPTLDSPAPRRRAPARASV